MSYAVFALHALLTLRPANAAEPVYAFESDGTRIDAAFQAFHPEFEDNGDFGESWFTYVQADDGGQFFGLLSVTNLGLKTYDCSYDVTYYDPGGTLHVFHRECERSDFNASTTAMDVTMAGARTWGGNGAYHFTISDGGTRVQLDMTNTLPAYKFGNGKVMLYADRHAEYTMGINAPRARASGSITIDGGTWPLAGTAYNDHGWATIKIPSYTRKWFTLRLFDPGYTVIAHHQYLSDTFGRENVKFGLLGVGSSIAGTSRQFLLTPLEWRTESNGMKVPTRMELTMNTSGYAVHGFITEARYLGSIDVLASLSWPVRTAIRAFYSNVWLMRFMGHYELDVTKDGATTHIAGEGLVEANYY